MNKQPQSTKSHRYLPLLVEFSVGAEVISNLYSGNDNFYLKNKLISRKTTW